MIKAWRTNLNEELQEELPVQDGTIKVKAKGKEIVTVKVKLTPWKLIDDYQLHPTRVLLPFAPANHLPSVEPAPVLTEEEVKAEEERAEALRTKLRAIRSQAYLLNEKVERQSQPEVALLADLQRLKGEEATLARQFYEARISALLNRQLFVTNQMESELDQLGGRLNWSRVRKRVGEFLTHYYEGLLREKSGTS